MTSCVESRRPPNPYNVELTVYMVTAAELPTIELDGERLVRPDFAGRGLACRPRIARLHALSAWLRAGRGDDPLGAAQSAHLVHRSGIWLYARGVLLGPNDACAVAGGRSQTNVRGQSAALCGYGADAH